MRLKHRDTAGAEHCLGLVDDLGIVPLCDEAAIHAAPLVDPPKFPDLRQEKLHAPHRKCVKLHGDNHAVNRRQCGDRGSGEGRRAVDQNIVVGVVLFQGVSEIRHGLAAMLPTGKTVHVKQFRGAGDEIHVAAPGFSQDFVISADISAQDRRKAESILHVRLIKRRSVSLRVCVNDQHPLAM